ncbi:hypothetical protein FOA52_000566 [Chlamydomonas sp. UWO 241]|nr:hypothetical protein FOA52_000566 [Chlamydomonas sp. UWO 241]
MLTNESSDGYHSTAAQPLVEYNYEAEGDADFELTFVSTFGGQRDQVAVPYAKQQTSNFIQWPVPGYTKQLASDLCDTEMPTDFCYDPEYVSELAPLYFTKQPALSYSTEQPMPYFIEQPAPYFTKQQVSELAQHQAFIATKLPSTEQQAFDFTKLMSDSTQGQAFDATKPPSFAIQQPSNPTEQQALNVTKLSSFTILQPSYSTEHQAFDATKLLSYPTQRQAFNATKLPPYFIQQQASDFIKHQAFNATKLPSFTIQQPSYPTQHQAFAATKLPSFTIQQPPYPTQRQAFNATKLSSYTTNQVPFFTNQAPSYSTEQQAPCFTSQPAFNATNQSSYNDHLAAGILMSVAKHNTLAAAPPQDFKTVATAGSSGMLAGVVPAQAPNGSCGLAAARAALESVYSAGVAASTAASTLGGDNTGQAVNVTEWLVRQQVAHEIEQTAELQAFNVPTHTNNEHGGGLPPKLRNFSAHNLTKMLVSGVSYGHSAVGGCSFELKGPLLQLVDDADGSPFMTVHEPFFTALLVQAALQLSNFKNAYLVDILQALAVAASIHHFNQEFVHALVAEACPKVAGFVTAHVSRFRTALLEITSVMRNMHTTCPFEFSECVRALDARHAKLHT